MEVIEQHIANSFALNDPFEDSKSQQDNSVHDTSNSGGSEAELLIAAKHLESQENSQSSWHQVNEEESASQLGQDDYQHPLQVIQQLIDKSNAASDPFASK